MSVLKDAVKQWFETGDYPTEAQFNTWFNSIRWNDEKIVFADLHQDIIDILNSLPRPVQVENLSIDGYVTVPSDCIVHMITLQSATPGDTITYSKNAVLGAEDLMEVELTSNKVFITQSPFQLFAGDRIYFWGFSHLTTIKIYKV